ncbi:arrestin domain-containing protein [Sclerotinia borealis F-4128]|uniref:Arrestin domain-containing protein n=1 Tax=Sclerotinia borealis (strain F-4128) TaxID=1432307 RepID=W9CAY7_SCLBF|nr:arrestin domain-containing protein [Sclerotinia borealis F-4128]
MSAFVRVSGPPNSNFLVGYPGISATLPRIEGKVEIRPLTGISAPIAISLVRICLQRRETVHPSAESIAKKHLGTPRRETTDVVGKELLLFRCTAGRESESVVLMDLPFVLFIPFGRGGEESNRRIPPASLQLPSRTAETYYELVVTVQQGQDQKKFAFPVPIQRYDTLSTFGMYNRPESAEKNTDHLVTLGISIPRWSFGPSDPVSVYIKLSPNPIWLKKATKVVIQKITIGIEEEITYNPEGDEPTKKINRIAKQTQTVGVRLPEAGYFSTLGLVYPSKELRDSEGIAHLSGARDITHRQPIVVCPLDQRDCQDEMDAIEQAAKDASHVDPTNPMLPACTIIRAKDENALRALGWTMVLVRFDRDEPGDIDRGCLKWTNTSQAPYLNLGIEK